MTLYLRDDFQAALDAGAFADALPLAASAPTFERLFDVRGDVHRQTARRRTLRLVSDDGAAYFAKLHDGVGWREILKNLLVGKPPVLGARNEYAACRVLAEHGVRSPTVAAFGEQGGNPATRRSFVFCDALEGRVSLEELARQAPPPALKRRLVVAVGRLARAMHDAGVHHRDFYLAHLLADADELQAGRAALAVIDLHRARLRSPLPLRWRCRDLAALLYSANSLGVSLTSLDRARFVAAYIGKSALPGPRGTHFWRRVGKRAEQLAERARAKGVLLGNGAWDSGSCAASIGSFADLGRTPPLPFRVDVDLGNGGRRLVCTETLRSQPGRRFVARTTIDGQDAVLKAFFGRRASRDFQRERRGVEALKAAGVAAPKLLGTGRGGGARVLAFAFVDGRRPLVEDANRVLALLAKMHDRGVRQRDLHLGNFLARRRDVLPIDAGDIRRARRVWNWQRLQDAARLLAEFAPPDAPDAAAATQAYAKAFSAAFQLDPRRLGLAAARARRKRVRQLMAKSVRDCTPFAVRRHSGRFIVTARGDDDPALLEVIADPERALAGGTVLKQGNTAKVVRVGELAVKRYRVKGPWHRLRLKFKPSRARRAWQAGHGLRCLGIATPRPRALIECRSEDAAAYLVCDFAGTATLGDETSAPLAAEGAAISRPGNAGVSPAQAKAPVNKSAGGTPALPGRAPAATTHRRTPSAHDLFERWREAGFSHGDTKATNFVVSGNGFEIVDLDAAAFHRFRWTFERAHRRDHVRWLRNWATDKVRE